MKYYGVSQTHCGHEYRYIFDEKTLNEYIYDNQNSVTYVKKGECRYDIFGIGYNRSIW